MMPTRNMQAVTGTFACALLGVVACGSGSQPTPTSGSPSGAMMSGNNGAAGIGNTFGNAPGGDGGGPGNGTTGTNAPPSGRGGMVTPPSGGDGGGTEAGASGPDGSMTGSGGAGDSGTDGPAGDSAGASASDGSAITHCAVAQALPPITDYTQDGPFMTTVEGNVGPSNNYTIYRPDPLGANGFVHPPIIFGPGISTSCAPGGALNVYTTLLNHLATHGFVTICVNSLTGGPGDPGNLSAMQMGIDWLIAQNTQSGSEFEGKLAVDCAVGSGYSIGATASTELSSDPAIMTTVSVHGHQTTGQPHGPLWLMTGTSDVIDANRMTLASITTAPAVMTALPIGHLDVPTEIAPGGSYIGPITAWLRFWVYGDQGAKHFFFGANCDVCTSPWITPESNDLWKALPP